MNSPRWYLDLLLDIRTLGDAVAVPKIIGGDVRRWFANLLIDHTKFGGVVAGEVMQRYHLRRMEELGSSCYCIWHSCDVKDCPDDGSHPDDTPVPEVEQSALERFGAYQAGRDRVKEREDYRNSTTLRLYNAAGAIRIQWLLAATELPDETPYAVEFDDTYYRIQKVVPGEIACYEITDGLRDYERDQPPFVLKRLVF